MITADPDRSASQLREPAWREFVRAPLVPPAVAVALGLTADRFGPLPWTTSLLLGIAAIGAWLIALFRRSVSAHIWLWVAFAATAAGYHHLYRNSFHQNDVATFAADAPTPARVRGTLAEEPIRFRAGSPDPLRTMPAAANTLTVLAVTAVETRAGWTPASGRARLTIEGDLAGIHRGDEVEVVGQLLRPTGPANPGEWDRRSQLLDQRITAELRSHGPGSVTRLEEGWRASLLGWLAAARGWGTRTLQAALPARQAGIAAALLLGETAAMDRTEWDVYVRTGVVHVLAISGQHLVILAGFAWLVLRVLGVRQRSAAWAIALFMVGYALLTGARPSAVRAAVMVGAACGGIILRRRVMTANVFALAWLVVIVANPTDPFTLGCQLSFLSVFVLVWLLGPLLAPRERTPIEELIDASRSISEKLLRASARVTWTAFVVSLVLGIINAPLILAGQNIVSPIGVVLGPLLVLLTTCALVTGFLLLLVSPLGMWAAWPFARLTEVSLTACDALARVAEQVPGAWLYAPGPAMWWLVGFYTGVTAGVLLEGRWRIRVFAALGVWTVFGLVIGASRPADRELRVTFLAVGDGGCVVIETPDGRVLLYDAGTMAGPEVVRRTIAPFLWDRGITQIDELFLSHADLDHFNGVPALLDRFAVGRVTVTPAFREKPTAGVTATWNAIERHGVPVRVVGAGDRFAAGDVSIEVIHPPATGLNVKTENARSLVLLLEHERHTILLTGDLDEHGQPVARRRPIPAIDVMLAPHHGSPDANEPWPGLMAVWARPRFVVSCQRQERGTAHLREAYERGGANVWDTATAGAITVRSHATGLVVSSFRTGEVNVIRRGR